MVVMHVHGLSRHDAARVLGVSDDVKLERVTDIEKTSGLYRCAELPAEMATCGLR